MEAMLDIETLGTTPEAAVVAIAVKSFAGDRAILRRINRPSGEIDSGTVRWWIEHALSSPNAVLATFGKPKRWARQLPLDDDEVWLEEPQPEKAAIEQVDLWLRSQEIDRLWAKSPSFDCVILQRLWARHGLDFPVPFWKWRDVRTAVEDRIVAEVPHDPMSDVDAQIEAVKRARQTE